MKVKYASQIFSRTISSNMGFLADKGILPEECKETADFLLFMDNLFDSVNGRYSKNKYVKPLLGPVTPTSMHKKLWREGKKLQTLQFVNQRSLKTEFVPTVQSWITTLNGVEDIVAINFFIFNYCKDINKIIFGKRSVDDNNDSVQLMAHSYCKKFLKNKR